MLNSHSTFPAIAETLARRFLHPSADVNDVQENPKSYYKCDSYHFKRDAADAHCQSHIVCRALIETLYQLRNQLFHGEPIPSKAALPIYQNAYFLLKMILEKIK